MACFFLNGGRDPIVTSNVRRLAVAIVRRGGRVLDAVRQAVRLGMLDRADLNAVTADYYARKTVKYHQDEYNASGLSEWERQTIERWFGRAKSLLVASAGAGREVVALAQRGFAVTAFECAPALVEEGRARLLRAGVACSIVLAEPDEVPVLGTFDGAVVGWGAYTHIAGRAARVGFLRGLRAQLADEAPLLLSFRVRGEDGARRRLIAALGTALRRVRRRSEAVELGDELTNQFLHYANRAETAAELERAGFDLQFFSDEPYGHAVGLARTLLPGMYR